MTDRNQRLAALRDRIDEIDNAIHDLVMERAMVAARIAKVKVGTGLGGVIRPRREALILRRLMARHHGRLPQRLIADLWRLLIAGCVDIQAPFSVQLFGGGEPSEIWDMAKTHFGVAIPMALHDDAAHVIASIHPDKSLLAVLPTPAFDEVYGWWTHILADVEQAPRIIARLPFVEDAATAANGPSAYVVGCMDRGETGDDVTLVAASTDGEVSRARLIGWFQQAGLSAQLLAMRAPNPEHRRWMHLISLPGYLTGDEPELAALVEISDRRLDGIGVIGGHAAPIILPAVGSGTGNRKP